VTQSQSSSVCFPSKTLIVTSVTQELALWHL